MRMLSSTLRIISGVGVRPSSAYKEPTSLRMSWLVVLVVVSVSIALMLTGPMATLLGNATAKKYKLSDETIAAANSIFNRHDANQVRIFFYSRKDVFESCAWYNFNFFFEKIHIWESIMLELLFVIGFFVMLLATGISLLGILAAIVVATVVMFIGGLFALTIKLLPWLLLAVAAVWVIRAIKSPKVPSYQRNNRFRY